MELLTAVNRILPVLGEHPVTSIALKHPTLAILLPILDTTIEDITMQGLWFNTFKTTLYPDAEGRIAVPLDTLSFVPTQHDSIVRGVRLYNAETMDYQWTEAVPGVLITRVPFHELPESAASLVWYTALVSAYVTDLGLEKEVQLWSSMASAAKARMSSEHLRNKKYTTRKSPRYQRLLSAMRA